jgi:hypothetical protein
LQVIFWQLIKSSNNGILGFKNFRSTEKSQKIWSTDYETFDQLKKHNSDQVNFGQTTPCQEYQLKNIFIAGKEE